MSISDVIVVICSTPDEDSARRLSTEILVKQLAACVTILNNAVSMFYWNGKLKEEHEMQMLIKTNLARQELLFNYLKCYHPYKIPELLALSVINCDNDYKLWINKCLFDKIN